jgi:hypothetical protein
MAVEVLAGLFGYEDGLKEQLHRNAAYAAPIDATSSVYLHK